MKNPDFLCIGAPKAGTTWLYNIFKDHPDFQDLPIKELHYYDELHRGVKRNIFSRFFGKHWQNKLWKKTLKYKMYEAYKSKNFKKFIWLLYFFFAPRNKYWYKRLFPNKLGKVSGDFTPDYCEFDDWLIKKIKKDQPDAKIILLLRNPIDRDWSHVRMTVKRYLGHDKIEDAKAEDVDQIVNTPFGYSNYKSIIEKWSKHYDSNKIYIGFYDQIKTEPEVMLKDIYKFLGINDQFKSEKIKKKFNAGTPAEISPIYLKTLVDRHKKEMVELADYFKNSNKNYPQDWINSIEE